MFFLNYYFLLRLVEVLLDDLLLELLVDVLRVLEGELLRVLVFVFPDEDLVLFGVRIVLVFPEELLTPPVFLIVLVLLFLIVRVLLLFKTLRVLLTLLLVLVRVFLL